MVTHSPPLVSISIAASGKNLKDTAHNIKATKQFVVSIISEPFVENANVCSLDAPPEINEWVISGLTKEPSVRTYIHIWDSFVIGSTFIDLGMCTGGRETRESEGKRFQYGMRGKGPVNLFSHLPDNSHRSAKLYQETDIMHPTTGDRTATLFLGLVKHIHVRNDMMNDRGTVDPGKLMPIGRMGDILYGSLGGGYRITRPAWKSEGEVILDFLKSTSVKEDSKPTDSGSSNNF